MDSYQEKIIVLIVTLDKTISKINKLSDDDKRKLKKWNWGAFFLSLLWTTGNKLEIWTVFCIIPFLNIIIMFYLGYYGNRLAYNKSSIDSVDDFMVIQKYWGAWGIGLFLTIIGLLALQIFFEMYSN